MAMDVKNTSTSSGLDQSLKIQTTNAEDVDGPEATSETIWPNQNWTTYNGYYKNHSSAKSTINKLGMWAVGKGVEGEEKTLEKIKGSGKDTASEVFDNQIRVKHINGDSYAEIITDDGEKINDDGSNLLNLKPLNPGRMGHKITDQGIMVGYSYKNPDGTETPFDLEDIFHLVMNRTADETHGTGDIASITTFLDKIKQLDEDMSVMFHRYVLPLIIWKLNTDDTTAITEFKVQEKAAWNKGDNLVTPDKAVGFEFIEPGKGGVNPLDWRNKWVEEVVKGGGVPALIMAIESGTTEASSKMVFHAWTQTIEKEQRDFEAQVKAQLHLEIKLPDPPQLDKSIESDENKDDNSQIKTKPSDTATSLAGTK